MVQQLQLQSGWQSCNGSGEIIPSDAKCIKCNKCKGEKVGLVLFSFRVP